MNSRFVVCVALVVSAFAPVLCASRAAAELALPAWMQLRYVAIEDGATVPAPVKPLTPEQERAFHRASWNTGGGAGMLVGGMVGAAVAGTRRGCGNVSLLTVPISAAVAIGGLALTVYGTRQIRTLRNQHPPPAGFAASTAGRAFLVSLLTAGVLSAATLPASIVCSD